MNVEHALDLCDIESEGGSDWSEENDPEIEIDTPQDNGEIRKDEIEDNSEDLGGHEIIIDESLSEEDEDEVTKVLLLMNNTFSGWPKTRQVQW